MDISPFTISGGVGSAEWISSSAKNTILVQVINLKLYYTSNFIKCDAKNLKNYVFFLTLYINVAVTLATKYKIYFSSFLRRSDFLFLFYCKSVVFIDSLIIAGRCSKENYLCCTTTLGKSSPRNLDPKAIKLIWKFIYIALQSSDYYLLR